MHLKLLFMTISFFLAPANESLIKSNTVSGTTKNYSQLFKLTDCKCLCDMQTISDELMESFQSQLLSGAALRIPIKKMESIWSYVPTSVTNSKFDIPMSRAYTRLNTLFCSFVRESATAASNSVLTNGEGKNKLCNSFYVDTGSSETLLASGYQAYT